MANNTNTIMDSKIESGLIFGRKNKIYTVIEVTDSQVVFTVLTPGKEAKLKKQSIKKFSKKLKDSNVFINEQQDKITHRGIIVRASELIAKDLILETPLKNGMDTIFCFAIKSNNGEPELLIGRDKRDNDPIWKQASELLPIVDKDFLKSISDAVLEGTSQKDIQKQALDIIKKLDK